MRKLPVILLCLVLSVPAFAGNQRLTSNSRNDDSPFERVQRIVKHVVDAVKYLLPVAPLDDGGLGWPKP